MLTTMFLAFEGVPPTHVAAKIAVPLAILIFGGAVFALLWSNYGAKKGALIYGTALFGFMAVLGVFWWFGAPGTPVATGLQNFPGQANDEYQSSWYAFEPGSPRAEFFPATNSIDNFQDLEAFTGTSDTEDPLFSTVRGDLDSVSQQMVEQYLPTDASGNLQVGASKRQMLQDNTPEPEAGEELGSPAYVAEVNEVDGESQLFVTVDQGQRVAAAELVTYAVFVDAETGAETRRVVVDTEQWFAFKDPGSIWLPSAVWTLLSAALFGLCLFGLDRIEMREKRDNEVVEEPQDVEVPIAQ